MGSILHGMSANKLQSLAIECMCAGQQLVLPITSKRTVVET